MSDRNSVEQRRRWGPIEDPVWPSVFEKLSERDLLVFSYSSKWSTRASVSHLRFPINHSLNSLNSARGHLTNDVAVYNHIYFLTIIVGLIPTVYFVNEIIKNKIKCIYPKYLKLTIC